MCDIKQAWCTRPRSYSDRELGMTRAGVHAPILQKAIEGERDGAFTDERIVKTKIKGWVIGRVGAKGGKAGTGKSKAPWRFLLTIAESERWARANRRGEGNEGKKTWIFSGSDFHISGNGVRHDERVGETWSYEAAGCEGGF